MLFVVELYGHHQQQTSGVALISVSFICTEQLPFHFHCRCCFLSVTVKRLKELL